MRYEPPIFRPPSEADSYILQASIGCSWNHCTYCAMYRDKSFRVRDLEEVLADIDLAGEQMGDSVRRVFVADGDALVMGMEHWEAILARCRQRFGGLRRVSSYAMAPNLQEKTPAQLRQLREWGLSLLYLGPESGDDLTLKSIAKGSDFADHVEAAGKAHAAGMRLSVIFLLGAGGVERSRQHAEGSAALATAMDPAYLSALTLTVVPGTPLARLQERGAFRMPDVSGLLVELRAFIAATSTSNAVFRCNHASNYLPLGGRLARDRSQLIEVIDQALAGERRLRPEWLRGL